MHIEGLDFHNKHLVWVYPDPQDERARNAYLKLLYQDFSSLSIQALPLWGPRIWKQARHSVVHQHWFEFRSVFGFLRLIFRLWNFWIYKQLGGSLYWTFHNIEPHQSPFPRLQRLLMKTLWRLSDRVYLHHSRHIGWVQDELNWTHPDLRFYPHPNYAISSQIKQPPEITSSTDSFFLIYGQVSPYKNTQHLLETLKEVPIIVAGIAKEDTPYIDSIHQWIAHHPQHTWINRFINEEEEAWLHQNCLGILFGFQKILYSGGVHLANQYQKPLILPQLKPLEIFPGLFYENSQELLAITNHIQSKTDL